MTKEEILNLVASYFEHEDCVSFRADVVRKDIKALAEQLLKLIED